MYYILNKSVKFHPDISELSIINEGQSSVILSKPACRLLLTLTHNSGNVVSREDLLRIVWAEYGYTPSNNNLYMAISELRKAFSSLCNESDILITVPKVGLKLGAAVDCIENKKNVSKSREVIIKPAPENKRELKRSVKIKIALSLIMIILSSAFFTSKITKTLPVGTSKDAYAFRYRECTVFSHTLSSGRASNNDEFRQKVIGKLKEYNVSCDNIKKDVYFEIISGMYGPEPGYFIGACGNMTGAHARSCQTITERLN